MTVGYVFGLVAINIFIYTYEAVSPVDWWFEYEKIELLGDGVKRSENPAFRSFMEYHRDLHIRWEDTLYCQHNGTIDKYRTQFWPDIPLQTEFKSAGTSHNFNIVDESLLTSWSYTEQEIGPQATRCYMQFKAIATTPHYNIKKVYEETSDWFPVNQ